jgi:hypothetical protein
MEANRKRGTQLEANNPQNLHVFETGYTKKNQYDNFTALTNRDPVKEYRLVVMPEYVTLTYSVVIFTNHLEQNNKITEAFQYAANTYWGESGRFQFRANIEQFATSTEYAVNEERTTRTNFTITLNGYIIPDTVNRDISYPKKYVSKAQIVFNLETDDTEIFTIGTAIKGRNKSKGVNFPTQAQTINIVETPNEALIYLSTIVTKTGANLSLPSNNTIRVLNSTIYAAPSPLPSTNKTNFEVIINSTYIPNNLVLSVTQNGSNIDIVIDTASLGYNLVTTEGMSVFGKFV